MGNDMFYKTEYCLKYKDEVVFKFNMYNKTLNMVNENLLPLSLHNKPISYDLIKKFCADRILMLNREYCKEILTACGIDDQNDVTICVMCKGLSFRDNYWISRTKSTEAWKDVNLYQNEFSLVISKVALTGNMSEVTIDNMIGDKIFTGELTNKGTRAKCYIRNNGNLLLFKNETRSEILSEIITYNIAAALNIPCSQYIMKTLFEKECSVCQIFTSEQYELIPCRDIMSMYNSAMAYDSDYYRAFMSADPANFIKMQILDYVTLNTDRNRDNFGLLRNNGNIVSLYPLFDHDSCFKGKNTNGIYFPTGLTFAKTLEMIKTQYCDFYRALEFNILNLKNISKTEEFKAKFVKYKSLDEYNSMIKRIERL